MASIPASHSRPRRRSTCRRSTRSRASTTCRECILIDGPDEPALGAGEPTIGTVGGAIANAVFAAVGARVRRLPMTPERVPAALAA